MNENTVVCQFSKAELKYYNSTTAMQLHLKNVDIQGTNSANNARLAIDI